MGPDFQQNFVDSLPTGNVDIAPTVAQIFGLSMPKADGRPLYEALPKSLVVSADYTAQNNTVASTAANALNFVLPTSLDGSGLDTALTGKSYSINLQTKALTFRDASYIYFDYAKALRQ
jgi:hypothetical protein